MLRTFAFEAIGVAKTPFRERIDAPRQSATAKDVAGTVELFEGHGFEDALDGLADFTHVWLLFAFDRNEGHWRPKVQPPRSREKRIGVFATRSPHRPNPIGLSVVELLGVEGRTLRVRGIDLLDGTPIFDIKPYLAYADSIPSAGEGWVNKDPEPAWDVALSERAESHLRWLEASSTAAQKADLDLRREVMTRLALGPQPHAYRRIKVLSEGRARMAIKDFRVFFRTEGKTIVVEAIATGYREAQLADGGQAPELHRAFARNFPDPL